MGWYDRAWDITKLGGTVGVDGALHQIPPPWEGNLFGPVLNEIAAALVSALIVLSTFDGLFRRPVLRLSWQRDNVPERTSEIRYEPVPQTEPSRLHVSGVLEGGSPLIRWLRRRRGFYTDLSLLVSATPTDALTVTNDRSAHARAGAVSGGFARMQLADLAKGATAWMAFTIELDTVPAGQPVYVTLGYEFQRQNRAMRWFDQYRLRRDFAVETIQAIRR